MGEIQPTINPALSPMNGELDALCRLIREQKVILWVGSGFSSYAGYPIGTQLPSMLLSHLGELPEGAPDPETASLQEAADYYVEQKERSGLNTFLVEQYGKEPSRCDMHDSLALINRVKYIVTTNYDPLFERAYGDRVVVISRDEDLPQSTEYPDKTILLKIHGDITQPDTIIITSEDYKNFDSDTIVWNKIRTLLAEYSVVFIGYSLHDPNVETMLQGIYTRLKGKKHPYFFISRTIDDAKRKDLEIFGLHFIEMEAAVAIEYITGNAIQYSFVDGMKNPSLLAKSDQIFDHQGFRVDRTFTGGKVTHASLILTRPEVHCNISFSISSKSDSSPKFKAFYDVAAGKSFDPVKLTDEESCITINDAQINGVFAIDPEIKTFKELSIIPHPSEEVTVDLQLQNQPIRLSNLKMRIFKSETSVRFEIIDPFFTFTLSINFSTGEHTVNYSGQNIIPDIERARIIYSLVNGWLHGENIELLWEKFSSPLVIQSSSITEGRINIAYIDDLFRLYSDLSDIQKILKVKLQMPKSISPKECGIILEIAAFIRGEKQPLNGLKTRFGNTAQIRPLILKDELGLFRMADIWETRELFGKTLQIPFAVECEDALIKNIHQVRSEIEREDEDLHIEWGSKTGKIFKKYEPLSASVKSLLKSQKEGVK